MGELKAQLLEISKKHTKALALEIIELIAVPALEEVVKKSATPVDDVIVAAIKEPLKAELKKAIEAL